MDIGATICRPRNPDCARCPLVQDCAAFRTAAPEAYPRRAAAKVKPAGEGAVFFARRADGAFLARRRPPQGLLASTVELPGTPWTSEGLRRGLHSAAPVAARWRRLPGTVGQVFTHFALTLTVYAAAFEGGAPDGPFLGRARRGRRGGIFERDAQGGRPRLQARMTGSASNCYGNVKASPLVFHPLVATESLRLAR